MKVIIRQETKKRKKEKELVSMDFAEVGLYLLQKLVLYNE
jgi:hypothetical protein